MGQVIKNGERRWFAVFMVAGIAVSCWAANQLWKAFASTRWPSAEGRVISSSVEMVEEVHRLRRGSRIEAPAYRAAVTYSYRVGDALYTGDRVSFGDYSSSIPGHARNICERYPPGKTIEVYYDPEDPRVSVIEPGVSVGAVMPLLIGLVFVTVGVIGLFGSAILRRLEQPRA